MRAERRGRSLSRALARAGALAGLYGLFLRLGGTDAGETVFAASLSFGAMVAVGCLLHWRDIIEAVAARRRTHGCR